MPDYSIGATVLVVAITLPFFVLTRAEHLHRVASQSHATAAPTLPGEDVITTPDLKTPGAPSPTAHAAPPSASPSARHAPVVKKPTANPTPAPSLAASPTSTPTATPSPVPDAAPIAQVVVTVGPGTLSVTADASGSTDTDQTPIAEVIFNFGDGTTATLQSGRIASHTYKTAGTYTVAVAVIDSSPAHLSSTASTTVTVA